MTTTVLTRDDRYGVRVIRIVIVRKKIDFNSPVISDCGLNALYPLFLYFFICIETALEVSAFNLCRDAHVVNIFSAVIIVAVYYKHVDVAFVFD